MAKEQAETYAWRQKTHGDYEQATVALEQSLVGVRKALGTLRDYYAQKDESSSLAQQLAMPGQHSWAMWSATSIVGMVEVVESVFAANLATMSKRTVDNGCKPAKTRGVRQQTERLH